MESEYVELTDGSPDDLGIELDELLSPSTGSPASSRALLSSRPIESPELLGIPIEVPKARICGPRYNLRVKSLGFVIALISLTLALLAGIVLGHLSSMSPNRVLKSPCGNSSIEARENGCIYDYTSFAWLHPRCTDLEMMEEFRDVQDWQYFIDRNGSKVIPFEEVVKGDLKAAWVTWEYHLVHCTFMWRMLHRKMLGPLGKSAVNSYLGDMEHTIHCGRLLQNATQFRMKIINSEILPKFPDCGIP